MFAAYVKAHLCVPFAIWPGKCLDPAGWTDGSLGTRWNDENQWGMRVRGMTVPDGILAELHGISWDRGCVSEISRMRSRHPGPQTRRRLVNHEEPVVIRGGRSINYAEREWVTRRGKLGDNWLVRYAWIKVKNRFTLIPRGDFNAGRNFISSSS